MFVLSVLISATRYEAILVATLGVEELYRQLTERIVGQEEVLRQLAQAVVAGRADNGWFLRPGPRGPRS